MPESKTKTLQRSRIQKASRNGTGDELVLGKVPTGIRGLDQVTHGGFPRGRTALVCGGPGAGKTLLGLEFLVRGATVFNEPGVCFAFEETGEELATNVASLGYDLPSLIRSKKLAVEYVHVERKLIEETGEYDLEALFIRLKQAIESINAKRVLLDTIELLFMGLTNEGIVRSELRRLFHWLKDQGVTAVITAEVGERTLTRYGLEEYVADCVIMLDHRVNEQISTRRLRVVKYRGSAHGTNEYPFLVDENGISVIPITSLGLTHGASTERVSSGTAGLDRMLGGKGFYRGSSILISGTAGTGKSSYCAAFTNAACARGEKALYFAFEESPTQILRNMSSVGIDLHKWMNRKLLYINASRPTMTGLEAHLAIMYKDVEEFRPSVVVVDPITNLISVGDLYAVKAMLTRLIDFLKLKSITAMFTNLVYGDEPEERAIGISSLMDSWLVLRDVQHGAERIRTVNLLKSRGMAHDSRVHSFALSDKGIAINGDYQTISATPIH
ncbi:MAG TPA: circadian clock protein KaiC [Candidatus Angelobacter sp.]|jgi:circadian clock protein KaiC|nr:circadian clock protein KaiC [Candidatus Angelobacter sp.]